MLRFNLYVLRMIIGWLFAIPCLVNIWFTGSFLLRLMHHHAFHIRSLLGFVFPVLSIVFGIAWWTIWKEKSSARQWGITASILFILIPISARIFLSWPIFQKTGVVLAVGLVGLILFSRHDDIKTDTDNSNRRETPPERI